jgi:hypothetical protein
MFDGRLLRLEPLESRSLLAVIALTPVADNSIFQESPQNSNGAGQYLFSGQAFTSAGIRRALLRFDVAGSIPAGSTINSATLELHVSKIQLSVPGPHLFGVHRVLSAWGEGASNAPGEEGTGTAASSGDATWSHRIFNQNQWGLAGGDFVASASSTTLVGGVGGYEWTGLAADVQAWLNAPSTQFGWMIKEDNENIEGSAKRFDSKESPTASFRPVLTIDYTPQLANAPPTLNAIPNPAPIEEDAAQQTVNLSGISAGAGESQQLLVTAASSNPELIPEPTVQYTSPAATGQIRYTPAANRSGAATLSVTVRDAGLDGTLGNGDDGTVTQSFSVTVNPINDPPTIDPIPSPAAIEENAGQQTINLSGISAGPLENQTLAVQAQSSNPALIQPNVVYTSPSATGQIRYTPAANLSGSATITVTVRDAGLNGIFNDSDDRTATAQFTVLVNPAGTVNQPPSFVKGSDQAATDEDGLLSVTGWATNISPGSATEQQQTVTFVVENNANGLFLTQPQIDSSGTLMFRPAPNVQGTALVTVRLKDNGGTANGGNDTSQAQTFNITITKPHVWHNAKLPLDVTDDGNIVAADALSVINYINAFRAGPVPAGALIGPEYYDTSADNFVAPNDALFVINFINAGGSGEGEVGFIGSPDNANADGDLLALLAVDVALQPKSAKKNAAFRLL